MDCINASPEDFFRSHHSGGTQKFHPAIFNTMQHCYTLTARLVHSVSVSWMSLISKAFAPDGIFARGNLAESKLLQRFFLTFSLLDVPYIYEGEFSPNVPLGA
jgi:hypothetical protein